jgi:hypothetical protein
MLEEQAEVGLVRRVVDIPAGKMLEVGECRLAAAEVGVGNTLGLPGEGHIPDLGEGEPGILEAEADKLGQELKNLFDLELQGNSAF